jgi:hypothetical protein
MPPTGTAGWAEGAALRARSPAARRAGAPKTTPEAAVATLSPMPCRESITREWRVGADGRCGILGGVSVLAVVLASHATYLANGFTWLDHGDIVGRRALLPASEWLAAFARPFGHTDFYRPLVTLSLSADSVLYADAAWGYHLTNVLLHLGVLAAFGWLLARHLGWRRRSVWLAMLLAGVHPLSWLPVGAISYRADLLAPLFLFLALGCYASARESAAWSRKHVLLAASAAAALLSKETSLFWIPAMLAAWEVRRAAPAGAARRPRSAVRAWSAIGLMILVYLLARSAAVSSVWHHGIVPLSAGEAVGTRLAALARQVEQLVDPRLPSLSDAMAIAALSPEAVAGGLVLIGLILGAVRWRGTDGGWICAFLAIALAPSLNIVALPRFTSPHYGYLAAFGAAMAVAAAFGRCGDRSMARIAGGAVVVWVAAATLSTFAGGTRFSGDESLFRPAVAEDDRFLEGHYYLGEAARRAGNLAEADAHLSAALRFRDDTLAYVDWVAASVGLAGVRLGQNRLDEAEQLLKMAQGRASAPARREIVYDQALVAARRGDPRRVVALLEPDTWDRPEPVLLLARSLAALGRRQDAAVELRRALPMLDEASRRHVVAMIHNLQDGDEP